MTDKSLPARTVERKKREAEALKTNMRRRKEQAKLRSDSETLSGDSSEDSQENNE